MNRRQGVYGRAELGRLLAPKSVAVVGASPTEGAFGRRTIENLAGFQGQVWAVNPKYDQVAGRPCFPSLDRLPAAPDAVVIVVPRERVEPLIEQSARIGAGGAIVYASGYAETGREDRRREQERLGEIAIAGRLPIIGPNCLGVINQGLRAGMTFMPDYPDVPPVSGGLGIVSQSGAMGYLFVQLPERAIGITHYLAAGNSCDADVCDFISYLAEDPATTAIACLFEGVRSGPRLILAAEKARAAGKAVVAYKMAVGEASRKAAMSHTGTLVGTDAAYRAAFARAGIVPVSDMEAMVETASFLAKAGPPSGRGPAVIVTSGGAGVIAADKAELAGVVLPQPAPELRQALLAEIPEYGSAANPCDVTAQVLNVPESFTRVIDGFLGRQEYGALVYPMVYAHPSVTQRRLPQLRKFAADHGKPVCVVWMTEWLEGPGAKDYEGDPRLCLFRSMARCMATLASWYRRDASSPKPVRRSDPAARGKALGILDAAVPGRTLTERESKALLALYGIPVSPEALAKTKAEAVAIAARLGYPVALKLESPDLGHKTEAGVVSLGLADAAAVEAAYDRIMAKADTMVDARINGVLVAAMAKPGVELVLGASVDNQFGPLVAVGLGGVLVEVLKDTAVGLAPVADSEAARLIDGLKGRVLLEGYRGMPKVERAAVLDLVIRLSELIGDLSDRIAEVDVNPVICGPAGPVAVDALVVKAP